MNKIYSLKQVKKILKAKKLPKLVFMSGAFDVFHHGHILALWKASQLGKSFVVQIDGDTLVKKRKGRSRPYIDAIYRARIIASFEFVDYVFISNLPSENLRVLRSINPDIYIRPILKDQTKTEKMKREEIIQKKLEKGKVYWLEQSNEISTTKIVSGLKLKKDMFKNKHFLYE